MLQHRIGPIALAATLLAACTTIHRVPRPATVEELQAMTDRDLGAGSAAARRGPAPGSILFQPTDGSPDLVAVPRDLALATMDSPGAAAYDSSRLRGYEITRTGIGALEGLGIGALTGLLAGGVIGAAWGDWNCRFECDPLPGREAMFGAALILGASLGVVGALIGAVVGHRDRYLF